MTGLITALTSSRNAVLNADRKLLNAVGVGYNAPLNARVAVSDARRDGHNAVDDGLNALLNADRDRPNAVAMGYNAPPTHPA